MATVTLRERLRNVSWLRDLVRAGKAWGSHLYSRLVDPVGVNEARLALWDITMFFDGIATDLEAAERRVVELEQENARLREEIRCLTSSTGTT